MQAACRAADRAAADRVPARNLHTLGRVVIQEEFIAAETVS